MCWEATATQYAVLTRNTNGKKCFCYNVHTLDAPDGSPHELNSRLYNCIHFPDEAGKTEKFRVLSVCLNK